MKKIAVFLVVVVVVVIVPSYGYEYTSTRTTRSRGLPSLADLYLYPPDLHTLNLTQQCAQQLDNITQSLHTYNHWAFQIWDSSGKQPSGLSSGSMYQLGNFDECLVGDMSKSKSMKMEDIERQYCLFNITVGGYEEYRHYNSQDIEYISIFDDMLNNSDPGRVRRDVIRWALCAPAACSTQELVTLVKSIMPQDYHVSLHPQHCQTQHQVVRPFSVESKICMSLLGILAFFVLTASLHHWFLLNRSPNTDVKLPPAVNSFSLIYQSKRLFMCTSSQNLRCLYGIRFFSICVVICGHRFGVNMSGPVSNRNHFEQILEGPELMFATHSDLVVDTFLVLSALLATVTIMKKENLPSYSLPLVVIYRLLRLLPMYAVVVMIASTVAGEWGSGPLWGTVAANEANYCKEYWWTNLLMINNYVYSEQMCMVHSWYLPVDFHLFVCSLGLIWWLRSHPRPALIILFVALIISLVIPAYITYIMRLPPTLLFYDDFLTNQRGHRFFQYLYIKTHTRMSPYILGIFTGYVLHYYRNGPKKLSRLRSAIVFVVLLLGILALLMSGSVFHDSSHPYSALEAALYAGLHRFLWALVLCSMILCCAFGSIPVISDILEWSGWSPMAKLTYGAYLIHMPLLLRSVSVARQPFFLEFYHIMGICFGDIAFAFTLSIMLYFSVEGPLEELSTLIFFPSSIHAPSLPRDLNNGTYTNKSFICMEEKVTEPNAPEQKSDSDYTVKI